MVSPVSNLDPIAFLDKISGKKPVTPATPTSTPAPAKTDSVSLSNNLVSLLQQGNQSANSGSPVASLLSSRNTSPDPLAGVYNTLANKSSAQPIESAIKTLQLQKANLTAQTSPVDNLLKSVNAASNAYNKTLIQNAKNAVAANNGQLT